MVWVHPFSLFLEQRNKHLNTILKCDLKNYIKQEGGRKVAVETEIGFLSKEAKSFALDAIGAANLNSFVMVL